jgi:hypothetical protein
MNDRRGISRKPRPKERHIKVRMRVVVRNEEKEEVKEMRMCEKERVDEIEGAWKKGGKGKTMRRPEEKKKRKT